ncbi:hypothetical protein LINPERPRIM_LOCUS26387 [Linum perenne]
MGPSATPPRRFSGAGRRRDSGSRSRSG